MPSAGTPASLDGHDLIEIISAFEQAAATKGRPTVSAGANAEGQGRLVCRRPAGLARQGVQEGRGGARHRRARGAVGSRVGREDRDPDAAQGRTGAQAGNDAGAAAQARRDDRHARGVWRGHRRAGQGRSPRRRARRRREELHVQREVRSRARRALLSVLHRRAGDDRRGHGTGRARRDSVSVDLRRVSHAGGRLHPHDGDQRRQREAGGLARRRVDWRGRTVADGARGFRDDDGAAQLHGAVSERRRQHRAAGRRRRRARTGRSTSARRVRRRR